jgi:hypothetical protein
MTMHAVTAAAESFMNKLTVVAVAVNPLAEPPASRTVVVGDRVAMYCTHRCDCVNRCEQSCCFRKPINTAHPTVVAYLRARMRDRVRGCGFKSGRLQCQERDDASHERDALGRKVHRRGMMTWIRK